MNGHHININQYLPTQPKHIQDRIGYLALVMRQIRVEEDSKPFRSYCIQICMHTYIVLNLNTHIPPHCSPPALDRSGQIGSGWTYSGDTSGILLANLLQQPAAQKLAAQQRRRHT